MTKALLPNVVRHFNFFSRKFVPKEEKILLYIYGHSSKRGSEWIEVALVKKIEVIQLPANTSHSLQQPCDDCTNKVVKENVIKALDVFLYRRACLSPNNSVKMKLLAAAYASSNGNLSVKRFLNCGLYPLEPAKVMSFAIPPQREPEPGTQSILPA